VRKDRPYRKTEFDRRRTVSIGGKDLWVVTPEDLLLSKLHGARTSRSELQLGDVKNLCLLRTASTEKSLTCPGSESS
jgi:hypothetical protein